MAIYYASAALTNTGTTGVANDPNRPYDARVLLPSSGSPANAVGDVIALKNDGVYSPASSFYFKGSRQILTAVATDGSMTNDRVTIDGAGLNSGFLARFESSSQSIIKGLSVRNNPYNSGCFVSATSNIFIGCDSFGHTGSGFTSFTGYGANQYYYCRSWNNISYGFDLYPPYTRGVLANKCASWNNNTGDFYCRYQNSYNLNQLTGCVSQPKTGAFGIYAEGSTFIAQCTIDGSQQAQASNNIGIRISAGTLDMSVLMNNIVANFSTTGALGYAIYNTKVSGRGNIAYNCAGNVYNTVLSPALITINPQFVDPSTRNFTPQADLSGIVPVEALMLEPNWMYPGAVR